jgi:transposase
MTEKLFDVGIDVSKLALEIEREGLRKTLTIANRACAIRRWLESLPGCCRVGVESTGAYHELVARLSIEVGHSVYVINPKDLWHYVRSEGGRAKTDRLDARAIRHYVAEKHAKLHPYRVPTPLQRELTQLRERRHHVVVMREQLQQSFAEMSYVPEPLGNARRSLQALIDALDRRMAVLVAQDHALTQAAQRLKGVVGFGPLLSTVLTHALTQRTFKDSDAFVAYTGLDPGARDSGQHRGRRRLTKRGPAELRRLLYVAAMSACKTTLWNPLYQRYRARGLASTEALIILARKLARLAFSMCKHNTDFNPAMIKIP